MTRKLTLHTLLPRGVGLTLLTLGTMVYLGVALAEWRLGSTYHTGLALALAAFFAFSGRGGRMSLGLALLLGLGALYGVVRAVTGLILLGLL